MLWITGQKRVCYYYLRQGGNIFAGFCLFVCSSVSQQDNSKVINGSF